MLISISLASFEPKVEKDKGIASQILDKPLLKTTLLIQAAVQDEKIPKDYRRAFIGVLSASRRGKENEAQTIAEYLKSNDKNAPVLETTLEVIERFYPEIFNEVNEKC